MAGVARFSLWLGFVAGFAACGVVRFVPSPYAPRELSVVWSEQEDVTVLRWKLGPRIDPDEVAFELFRDGRWSPVAFDTAPFPSGDWDCPAATCFLFSLRGRYEPPSDGVVLRSVHDHHGTLTAGPVELEERTTSLSFRPRFRAGNGALALGIDDALSPPDTPVRRRFRWHVVERGVQCLPSESFAGTTEGVETVPFREQPSDLGRYCATLEPVPDDGGRTIRLAAEALTHPVLEPITHEYKAPHEKAPVYLQLIVDLEIPNAARCLDTVAKVQERLAPLLRHGGGGHAFEPVWLAESDGVKCRQDPTRALDVPQLVENTRQYVNQHAPGRYGASVLFVYVSNLALPIPEQTMFSLFALAGSLHGNTRASSSLWAIAASAAFPQDSEFLQASWTSPFDKAFGDLVKTYDEARFPVRSSLHVSTDVIELASVGSVGSTDVLFKFCGATPSIKLMRGATRIPSLERVTAIRVGEPIGFTVDFPPLVRIDASQWKESTAVVRYELCRRWCTHPFESATGTAQGTWTDDPVCREAT